jgi:hypothetical protein
MALREGGSPAVYRSITSLLVDVLRLKIERIADVALKNVRGVRGFSTRGGGRHPRISIGSMFPL